MKCKNVFLIRNERETVNKQKELNNIIYNLITNMENIGRRK